VSLGENTLSDVARNRNLDPAALLAANPTISDLYARLSVGQEINLPMCQAPAPPQSDAHAGTPTAAFARSGDSLAKSVVQANLKAKQELPPDEQTIKNTFGEAALADYQKNKKDIQQEFTDASQSFLKSGRMPKLKHWTEAEIIERMTAAGGGKRPDLVSAKVSQQSDGYHFDFDRQLTQEQAAGMIFRDGKVPEGASLVKGTGNTWVLKPGRDLDTIQNTVNHFNARTEVVDSSKRGEVTFVWTPQAKRSPPTGPQRLDLKNDFGFTITKHYAIDQGKSPVAQVNSIGGGGHGYEVTFDKPMTKDEVMNKLFEKGRFGKNDVQLKAVPFEPSNVWELSVIGIDAATSFKTPLNRAFADAVTYAKESIRPGLPDAMNTHFENKTVPPNATKHPPDVYVWEQGGHIAYVQTDGKGYYHAEATQLSGDKASDSTIRYFVMEKGMPPRQGWQAYVKHWDDINREVMSAFALTLAAAGGMPGKAPEAGTVGGAIRRAMGNDGSEEAKSGVTAAARSVVKDGESSARAVATDTAAGVKSGTTGAAHETPPMAGRTGTTEAPTPPAQSASKGHATTETPAKPAMPAENAGTKNAHPNAGKPTAQEQPAAAKAAPKPSPKQNVNEQIREVMEWENKGLVEGDTHKLKARLRSKDPKVQSEAQAEFEQAKRDIKSGKKADLEEYQGSRRSEETGNDTRISDANKEELENSSWLKGEEPNPDRRREFMDWLKKNHKAGENGPEIPEEVNVKEESHLHIKPGSKDAKDMLTRWREEEGGFPAGRGPQGPKGRR
jgi:hypothetical protein